MVARRLWTTSFLFLISVVVSACGGSGGVTAASRSFDGKAEGIAVRYPGSWRLTTRNDNYVPDPALCFDLVPKAAPKVDLRVVEYLPPYFNPRDLSSYRPRPRQFRLANLRRGDEDWSPGKILAFREHRRVFFVGAVMPAGTAALVRRTAEQILDSLTIESTGRCRPTSGVGSHGVPSAKR